MQRLVVSGVFFCLLGIVAGLAAFAVLSAPFGPRGNAFDLLRPGSIGTSLMLAAMAGGIPAFVTGIVAVPLRCWIPHFWQFVPTLMTVGWVATALYLRLAFGLERMDKLVVLAACCGAIAALVCALVGRRFGIVSSASR